MLPRQHTIKFERDLAMIKRLVFFFSNELEQGLGKEMEGWEFCWESQVGDAFPVLGPRGLCGRKYDRPG